MKFDSENYGDIVKYFKNSYVKFYKAGSDESAPVGEVLATIDYVDSQKITGKVYIPNEDGTVWSTEVYQQPIDGVDGIELEYVLPRKSYFNYGNKAHLLLRIPARQYKKGVCSDNTAIHCLTSGGKFTGCTLGFEVLNSYVAKQAFSPFGTKDCASYAVSPRMACSKDGKVFTDKVQVGELDVKNKTVTVFHELFVPEIEKILSNHAQDWAVSVKVAPLPVIESIDDLFTKFLAESEE